MRKRAAQELNPQMGRMGAEDPSTAFRPDLLMRAAGGGLARPAQPLLGLGLVAAQL